MILPFRTNQGQSLGYEEKFRLTCPQGMLVGFLTAFCYNVTIVIGKFLRGGGSPQKLPLSTAGCPENTFHFANTSTAAILNTTVMPEHLMLHTSAFLEDLHHNTTLHHGASPG
ncbi:hypothetical protein E2C01_002476 [Portunus trituberculatus]|uniref:Uncharacterized protein n=1 Tax=Portunus trituberculatus TaxID=210409 RepID=A0A5B7CLA1_PORTR|nr:hypothetical protein [Portunus trituberculatus]